MLSTKRGTRFAQDVDYSMQVKMDRGFGITLKVRRLRKSWTRLQE
jgi:hypothetical protein